MTKRIALFFLATMMALFTASAMAQGTAVKGVCKDENGKPIAGGTVQLDNLANGGKLTVKTNNQGEYYTIGATAGNYKISLFGPDGKLLFYLNNAPVRLAAENVYDFDLSKQTPGVSEEQRKAIDAARKNNEKIKGLNALLLQAMQQKKEGKYDEAVVTLEQAVAQDQTHDVIYGALADAYIGVKKYPEAETAYDKAIALAPANSKSLGIYHSGLALALLRQGKTEAGLTECQKGAQIDPTQAGQCYFNAGAILTNMGKVDEANKAFDKSIAADPTRADAYYQKGVNLLGEATLGKDGKMVPAREQLRP